MNHDDGGRVVLCNVGMHLTGKLAEETFFNFATVKASGHNVTEQA
jgi:hypothetical protein